jgi:hypothetical protein
MARSTSSHSLEPRGLVGRPADDLVRGELGGREVQEMGEDRGLDAASLSGRAPGPRIVILGSAEWHARHRYGLVREWCVRREVGCVSDRRKGASSLS